MSAKKLPLRFGLVGCGNISRVYLKGLIDSTVVEITGCFDLSSDRRVALAEEFSLKDYDSLEALLGDPELDGVLNLTIPSAHAPVTRQTIEAGKHCYVEKPFAASLEEALELESVLRKSARRVGCAPANILSPATMEAARLIKEGRIGTAHSAHACWANRGPDAWHPAPVTFYQAGGGPLFDTGPYPLADIIRLFGHITDVRALAGTGLPERRFGSAKAPMKTFKPEIPTHYEALLSTSSGVRVSLVASFDVLTHTRPVMEIYGTSGTLSLPAFSKSDGEIRIRRERESDWESVPLSGKTPWTFGKGLEEFADSVLKNRSSPLDWENGLHLLAVMTAIQDAARCPGVTPVR